MIFRETALKGAYVIELEPFSDERGQFARSWCREEFARQGLPTELAQGNVSINTTRGTIRGMHYQLAPHEEIKLMRCVRGAIYDVIVDVRPGSPTFHQWIGVELTPTAFRMLYVPAGFAHGFQTLADDTEVNYLVSAPYVPDAARGLRYNDPQLAIDWPLPMSRISKQDSAWPLVEKADA